MDDPNSIQKPGTDIRPPDLSTEDVKKLFLRLYGVEALKVKPLNGYDDRNFHIIESRVVSKSSNIEQVAEHGWVLKIMNTLDSKNMAYIDEQTQLLIYIGNHGLSVPEPVRNIIGEYFSEEDLKKEDSETSYHVVRLFKYQPGTLLKDILSKHPEPQQFQWLFYKLGKKAAFLDDLMKEFPNKELVKKKSLWNLQNALEIKKYIFAVEDSKKVASVLKVLEEFEETIIKKLNELQTGLIHGDLNESNILINCGSDLNKEQCCDNLVILDFNDMHYSAFILELATLMCYMMILTKDISTGSNILKGYNTINPLPVDEYKLLPICVCARMCQSLVLGLYAHTLDPTNHYVLQTQEAGWYLLNIILSEDADKINNLWMESIIS